MYFHEIAEELKIYMAPSERGGIFVVQLIGDTLRAPMTEEEEKMALDDKFNPLANGMSLNMQDQIFEGKKFISRNRAGLICSRYDGADFAEEIDNLYDADKDHLQTFLAKKGILVAIEELGSAMQDIMSQIFHGLSKGIHDVDICLTIHEPKPSIKNLAENRIYFDDGKLVSVYPQDVIESRCLDCCLCFSEIPLFRFRFPVKPHFPTTSSISFILCMIAVLYE